MAGIRCAVICAALPLTRLKIGLMTTVPTAPGCVCPVLAHVLTSIPPTAPRWWRCANLPGSTSLRKLASLFSDRSLRLMFLASGVKASQEQFPQLYQMMLDGSYVLDLPTVPELFISQNPVVNAMTLGTDKPFIVITTGMVDLFDAEEMRFAIGHELGNALSGPLGLPDDALPPDQAGYQDRLDAARLHRAPGDHLGARGVVPQVGAVLRPGRPARRPGPGGGQAGADEDGPRRRMSELSHDAFHAQAKEYDAVPDVAKGC